MEVYVVNSGRYNKGIIRRDVRFFMNELIGKSADLLAVEIKFEYDLPVKGWVSWDDDPERPRDFVMEVVRGQRYKTLLRTLAHECCHIRQFYLGEYRDLVRKPGFIRWKGIDFSRDMLYDRLSPWEMDAFRRSKFLIKRYQQVIGSC